MLTRITGAFAVIAAILVLASIIYAPVVQAPDTVSVQVPITQQTIITTPEILETTPAEPTLPAPQDSVIFIAVGDIMPSRNVAVQLKKYGGKYAFEKTQDILKTGNLVFGNLESPLLPGREIKTGEMLFRADPQFVTALRDANFSVVSLANNHTPNFGEKGLTSTRDALDKAGIGFAGAGQNKEQAFAPYIITKNNIRFAFLAYNDPSVVPETYCASKLLSGTACMDIEQMKEDVSLAKQNADIVIVSLHAGDEYKPTPNEIQKTFAHAAVDAGADIVIGHHPHVVQTAEIYHSKYIFYSLGNFVFDQMWSTATRQGIMVKFLISKQSVDSAIIIPVQIYNYAQPQLPDKKIADAIIKRLQLKTEFMGTGEYTIVK